MSWSRLVGITAAAVALGLGGCSGSSDDISSASPTATPSPTAFPDEPECDEAAVKEALPSGSTKMQMFTCAPLTSGYWAAATINPGPKTYFLMANNGKWEQTDSPCGQNLPGMTDQIMDYCKS